LPSNPSVFSSANSLSAVRRSRRGRRASVSSIFTSRSANGVIFVSPPRRRYFGSTPSGFFSQFRIVFLVSPVRRSISDSDKPSRKCKRLTFPSRFMVIISIVSPLHHGAAKVNHLGNFQRAGPAKTG
jgi:hypothetical protein